MTSLLLGIKPARGLLYVRKIETEEVYRGGRVLIPQQAQDKIAKHQFEVVSVGDYARCPDVDECSRPHTKFGEHRHYLVVGSWILAKNRSWGHTVDPDIYVLRQDDVLGVFQEA